MDTEKCKLPSPSWRTRLYRLLGRGAIDPARIQSELILLDDLERFHDLPGERNLALTDPRLSFPQQRSRGAVDALRRDASPRMSNRITLAILLGVLTLGLGAYASAVPVNKLVSAFQRARAEAAAERRAEASQRLALDAQAKAAQQAQGQLQEILGKLDAQSRAYWSSASAPDALKPWLSESLSASKASLPPAEAGQAAQAFVRSMADFEAKVASVQAKNSNAGLYDWLRLTSGGYDPSAREAARRKLAAAGLDTSKPEAMAAEIGRREYKAAAEELAKTLKPFPAATLAAVWKGVNRPGRFDGVDLLELDVVATLSGNQVPQGLANAPRELSENEVRGAASRVKKWESAAAQAATTVVTPDECAKRQYCDRGQFTQCLACSRLDGAAPAQAEPAKAPDLAALQARYDVLKAKYQSSGLSEAEIAEVKRIKETLGDKLKK